jgi:glycosyltransferase involved in cell wall biosynthesis
LFLPDWRIGNPYQNLLANSIRVTGVNVGFENYPDEEFALFRTARKYPKVRAIHLHWVHPYMARIFWSGSGAKAYVRTLLLALDVLLVRLRGVKVIWTVHNLVSHESPDERREITARRWLARASTRLVFHSAPARERVERLLSLGLAHKSEIIPHGHLGGMYAADQVREQQLRQQWRIAASERVVLFFGGIRRYKGVSRLLQALRELPGLPLRLIIAGRAFEKDLEREIESAARDDHRVIAYLGFIPDSDVHPLHSIAHIVAVPFERTLTSSSVTLAMSLGKALLLPDAARVLGLPDTRGTMFFTDGDGLKQALQDLAEVDLDAMGRINGAQAEQLDWAVIGRKTAALYRMKAIAPTDDAAGDSIDRE